MQIRIKTLFILAAFTAISIGANYLVLQKLVFPSFVDLEMADARENIDRVQRAIERDLEHIASTVEDWASWDDTYNYAVGENPGYQENNLYIDAFGVLDVNVVYIYDPDGKIIYGGVYDFDEWVEVEPENFLFDRLGADHPIVAHADTESVVQGIVATSQGPLLFVSRPILNNENEGPIHGAFVMGRFVTDAVIAGFSEQTRVALQSWYLESDALQNADRQALDQLVAGNDNAILGTPSETVLPAYSLLKDAKGKPVMLLRADTPKNVTAVGRETLGVAMFGMLAAGILLLAILALVMGRMITGPIVSLTAQMLRIGRSSDLSLRSGLSRSDEIGTLAHEFDTMLDKLEGTRNQLVEQSYHSGIAEMASGLLHNLRNQVSPMMLQIERLRGDLRAKTASKDKLSQAWSEINREDTAAERREKLLAYLKHSTDHLLSGQEIADRELDNIAQEIGQVEELLGQQDEISHAPSTIVTIDLCEVINRAINLMPVGPRKSITFDVAEDIGRANPVLAERFALTSVFQNLLVNAAEAIAVQGEAQGRITISAVEVEDPRGRRMVISIADNGCGIASDRLIEVFQRGFTSKAEGKGGLGLHWCANALAGFSGEIRAVSDGPGQGARFSIALPLAQSDGVAA